MQTPSWLLAIISTLAASMGCTPLGRYSPLASVERAIIYHPATLPDDFQTPPGVAIEDAHFVSEDGIELHGWYLPHPDAKAVALFMHGNAGNVASRGPTLQTLNERHRLSVMTFDYRGYGRSEGQADEVGILRDARAARRWLAQRSGVDEQDIVLMGRSLGGAVAVDLAAADGARGLVLASTFTSLPDVGRHHFRWLPTSLLMTQRLNSLEKIQHYQGPLLQSHGNADRTIPYALGQKLFVAAPGPKQFVTIEGGDHNTPQNKSYRDALDEFLDGLPVTDR